MSETRTFPEWQHRVRLEKKPYTYHGDARHVIRADAGLHYLRGNRLPYFTVTGEVERLFHVPGDHGDRIETCGCIHELIAEAFPALVPLVAMHLSDSNGRPSHDGGNAWYFLAGYYGGAGERYHYGNGSGAQDPEECLKVFAEYVRIPVGEAKTLADGWARGQEYSDVKRVFLEDWIKAQHPRWQTEADAAIALLDSLAQGKG